MPQTLPACLDARVEIATAPTPIAAAPALRGNLWVKDEGAIDPAYGGNKVRKLEFLLHGAAERVVTIGAAGSHHVLATAVHGARRGHRVEALAFPRPWTPHAEAVLHAATTRATLYAAADHDAAVAQFERRAAGATSFPAGGSSPLGTLGWVRAGLELAAQIHAGAAPRPRRIYLPLGTAGTVIGAALGLHLAGLPTPIVAVRVVPAEWLSRERVWELGEAVAALLGVDLPALEIEFDDLRLGGGYGVPTAEGRAAVARAEAAGLHLEPTYTGKTLAAALAADDAAPDLYWQTHSTRPLAGLLEGAPPLPADLAALLLRADPADAPPSPDRPPMETP